MLILLLFNIGAYSFLFQYFIYRSDSSIINLINNNTYKISDLVETKIPMHMDVRGPAEYEIITGQIHLQDSCYNYAEIKITSDTLYLMCIPNHMKAQLVRANNLYVKQVNDMPVNKHRHHSFMKRSIHDGEFQYNTVTHHILIPAEKEKASPNFNFMAIVKFSIPLTGKPPEASSILS